MLATQLVLANLICCTIIVIKSEELFNNTEIEATRVIAADTTATENDLELSALKDLPTPDSNPNRVPLNLENFQSSSSDPGEVPSLPSSTTIRNDLKDPETTAGWELIYPDQNSNNTTSQPMLRSPPADTSPAVLPQYFKVDDVANCRKFFDQCLQQVLGHVMQKLKDGNRLLNVAPLDPLYFNATAFQYNSGSFVGYVTIRYALIYGLTTMKFKKVNFYKQDEKFKVRLRLLVPNLTVIGSYKSDMHVNNVRVRPRGDFNISVTDLGVDLLSLGVVHRRDDHTFLKFTKGNATTTFRDSKVNATGIFPDQRLNEIVVNVANQYWRDLLNIVLPETHNNWLPILLDALNTALCMVPFDFFDMKSKESSKRIY